MACSLNYLACYSSYSVEERELLGTDLEHESDFLQELSIKICQIDQFLETSWDATAMMMTFDISANKCNYFTRQTITRIIDIIEDLCKKSFSELRHFGWCASYNVEGSIKDKLQFSGLNQSKNGTRKNK